MMHVAAKFIENTSMRFRVSAKTKCDGQTDRQTDGRTGDVTISPVLRPMVRREIIKKLRVQTHLIDMKYYSQ